MSNSKFEKFLLKYFEENDFQKTLGVFKEDLKKKRSATDSLSFTILKAPKNIIDIELKQSGKKKRSKKAVKIAKQFKRIARKVGIPKEHFEFFFEHRTRFNWNLFKPTGKSQNYLARISMRFKFTARSAKKRQSTSSSVSRNTWKKNTTTQTVLATLPIVSLLQTQKVLFCATSRAFTEWESANPQLELTWDANIHPVITKRRSIMLCRGITVFTKIEAQSAISDTGSYKKISNEWIFA